jgi:mono/diheme cytochrome c family protein
MTVKNSFFGAVALCFASSVPAEEISFSKDLMPLFQRSCATCHKREGGNENAVQNKVYYEKKEDLLSLVGTYIIAGNPDKSGLVKVLDQTTKFGRRKSPMPPPKAASPKWSDAELKKIRAWITAGAKDN